MSLPAEIDAAEAVLRSVKVISGGTATEAALDYALQLDGVDTVRGGAGAVPIFVS